MKIDKESFVYIRCIHDHIEETANLQLAVSHSATGNGCTSQFYRVSKKQVFNKCHKEDPKMNLLTGLGIDGMVTADS